MYVLDGGAPAVEAEHLIGEIDDLLRREVVDLASAGAGSRGDVFGSQLLFESRGECGNLLGGPLGDSRRGRREGVYCVGIVAMLITWPVGVLASCLWIMGGVVDGLHRHIGTLPC